MNEGKDWPVVEPGELALRLSEVRDQAEKWDKFSSRIGWTGVVCTIGLAGVAAVTPLPGPWLLAIIAPSGALIAGSAWLCHRLCGRRSRESYETLAAMIQEGSSSTSSIEREPLR